MPTRNLPPDRFFIICQYCTRQLLARDAWIGRAVQCPHCGNALAVPARPQNDQPVLAGSAKYATARRFNFPCPRCDSLLESSTAGSGQEGRCPTCNARFVVPHLAPGSQRPDRAQLLEAPSDAPQPVHAYAASGTQAPIIHRLDDGSVEIECPRCKARNDISVNNCAQCGVPFTMEGVTKVAPPQGGMAVASLLVGLASIPLAPFIAPGILAVILAALGWMRRGGTWPPALAIVGALLGAASTAGGLLML